VYQIYTYSVGSFTRQFCFFYCNQSALQIQKKLIGLLFTGIIDFTLTGASAEVINDEVLAVTFGVISASFLDSKAFIASFCLA
jgi:hypothetical protein